MAISFAIGGDPANLSYVQAGGDGRPVDPRAAHGSWLLTETTPIGVRRDPVSSRPPSQRAVPGGNGARTSNGRPASGKPVGGDNHERVLGLVDLARGGDAEAFGQLYDLYVGTVYKYVYYRVGAHALTEDLTSETFFRALRAMSSFTWQGRDFGAWLVTIARNLIADHYKSGKYRLEIATDDMLDHDSTTDSPEDSVLAAITNEILLECVKQLAPEQQECLALRFLQGLSIAETAKILDRSEGAIKQLQLRAVRNLAKHLPEGLR